MSGIMLVFAWALVATVGAAGIVVIAFFWLVTIPMILDMLGVAPSWMRQWLERVVL